MGTFNYSRVTRLPTIRLTRMYITYPSHPSGTFTGTKNRKSLRAYFIHKQHNNTLQRSFLYMLFISSKIIHPCFRTTHPLFSTGLSKLIFLQVDSHKIDALCVTKAALKTFYQISSPWERYKSGDHTSTNCAITNLCTCRYQ